jgi:prephenate dehydrogenase
VSRSKPTVAVVGVGLIGGSLARALSARGYRVVGVDQSASTLRAARRQRALSAGTLTLEPALAAADVVVLAAPPRANLALLRRVALAARARGVRRGVVVTDVSSVKRPICALADRLGLFDFVGGHPMAGRERGGFAASDGGLFRGRAWILTPGRSARALEAVRGLVRAAGARPVVLRADAHDRAMAFLSHLPQVVAWALSEAARRDGVARRSLALAGPAFADMTRIAKSPRGLWREILAENRDQLARALRAFRRALSSAPRPATAGESPSSRRAASPRAARRARPRPARSAPSSR